MQWIIIRTGWAQSDPYIKKANKITPPPPPKKKKKKKTGLLRQSPLLFYWSFLYKGLCPATDNSPMQSLADC